MKQFIATAAAIAALIIWFFDSKSVERRRTQKKYSKEFNKYVEAQTSLVDEELQEMLNHEYGHKHMNKDLRSTLNVQMMGNPNWSYFDKESMGKAAFRRAKEIKGKKNRPFWPDWDVYK